MEEDFGYSEEEALTILADNYAEIKECVTDRTGRVEIKKMSKEDFILSTGGGKVRSVIDNRN